MRHPATSRRDAPARGRLVRACALLVCLATLAACQPVDRVVPKPDETVEAPTATPLDAPVRGMPDTLAELIARAEPEARGWQDEPVLAEILVELGPGQAWRRAALTYLAADADRQLVLTVTAETISPEITTLAALQLRAIPERGMGLVPPLPPDVLEPPDLAQRARAALRDCDISGTPNGVVYASGAPVAWTGRRWATPPAWTATVTTGTGAVQLDPVTATPLGCVTA